MKTIEDYILEKLKISNDAEVVDDKERRNDPKTWTEGDILTYHGGATMIIVRFYKILKATGKTFKIRELKQKIVSGDMMRGTCIPVENEFESKEELTVRINKWNSVKVGGYGYCTLWLGKPEEFDHFD